MAVKNSSIECTDSSKFTGRKCRIGSKVTIDMDTKHTWSHSEDIHGSISEKKTVDVVDSVVDVNSHYFTWDHSNGSARDGKECTCHRSCYPSGVDIDNPIHYLSWSPSSGVTYWVPRFGRKPEATSRSAGG